MPPVWSWMDSMPVAAFIFTASTSLSMSASMTAMRSLSLRRSMVLMRVVVLPLPGEDMRLRRYTPLSFNSLRRSSASLSFSAKMLFFISITLTSSMAEGKRQFLVINSVIKTLQVTQIGAFFPILCFLCKRNHPSI